MDEWRVMRVQKPNSKENTGRVHWIYFDGRKWTTFRLLLNFANCILELQIVVPPNPSTFHPHGMGSVTRVHAGTNKSYYSCFIENGTYLGSIRMLLPFYIREICITGAQQCDILCTNPRPTKHCCHCWPKRLFFGETPRRAAKICFWIPISLSWFAVANWNGFHLPTSQLLLLLVSKYYSHKAVVEEDEQSQIPL